MVQVGLSILLQLVVNFVVDLDFDFFCLFLPLNFKPYFIMSSKVITEDMLKSSDSVENPIISVVISNYPLSNGGYLVSFTRSLYPSQRSLWHGPRYSHLANTLNIFHGIS